MPQTQISEISRRTFLAASAAAISTAALAQPAPAPAAQASDRKLGWALVGLGNLSQGQLLPGLTKTKFARLVGLVSGHPDKAKRLADKYQVDAKHIYSYENYDEIVKDNDIDVIYIVLPNGMHAEYTIRAARAGKHVFCEKPMEVNAELCQKMIDACKEAKRMLGIGYRMQYEPHLNEMRRMIKAGELGKVKSVESAFGFNIPPMAWRLDKKLAGGGPLMDVGIYCLNSTRYALGEEPSEVSATIPDANGDGRFKEVEPEMDFSLTFPSGVVAKCQTSYRQFNGNKLRIVCEGGVLHLEPAFGYGGVTLGIQRGQDRPTRFNAPAADQFATEMDDFSRCILENKPTRTPGEEGLRDVVIMQALYKSAADKKPVKLG
jgi:predicted dehydrogenase